MEPNQKKPVTSFRPTTGSTPQPTGAAPKPGEWDEQRAAEVAAEVFPNADKRRQTPTTDLPAAAFDSTEPAPDSGAERMASPIFRRVHDRLVHEVARGTSLAEAARRAGCSGRTAERRWKEEAFQDRVLIERAIIQCELVGRLTEQSKQALAVLIRGMSAKSESVRVSAARAILKLGQEMGGCAEDNALLAKQINALEAALAQVMADMQKEQPRPGAESDK